MFREIRRKKQQLSDAETIEISQSCTSGVLAVAGESLPGHDLVLAVHDHVLVAEDVFELISFPVEMGFQRTEARMTFSVHGNYDWGYNDLALVRVADLPA